MLLIGWDKWFFICFRYVSNLWIFFIIIFFFNCLLMGFFLFFFEIWFFCVFELVDLVGEELLLVFFFVWLVGSLFWFLDFFGCVLVIVFEGFWLGVFNGGFCGSFIFFFWCFCFLDCLYVGCNKIVDESYVNSCRVLWVIVCWMFFEYCIGCLIYCFKICKVCYYKE